MLPRRIEALRIQEGAVIPKEEGLDESVFAKSLSKKSLN
jgi:hypothetical protein